MTATTLTQTKAVLILLDAVTANTTSEVFSVIKGPRTVQASITVTGTVSCTVSWYGNNENSNTTGVLCATSTLSGTTSDHTGIAVPAEWPYMYCVLSSISGTGATVTATVGI